MPDPRHRSLPDLHVQEPEATPIPNASDSYDLERELIETWRAGENPQGACQELFEKYASYLKAFFRRRGFSTEEAEDLTQETFLKAQKGLPDYREEASLMTWLYRIAENVVRNLLRARSTHKRRGNEVPVEDLDPLEIRSPRRGAPAGSVTPAGPLAGVLVDEQLKDLQEALQQLSPEVQRCLILRVVDGLKYREIAVILKIPVGSVKSRLSRARQHLRSHLAHRYPDLDR